VANYRNRFRPVVPMHPSFRRGLVPVKLGRGTADRKRHWGKSAHP